MSDYNREYHSHNNFEMTSYVRNDDHIEKLKYKNRELQQKLEKYQYIIKELLEENERFNEPTQNSIIIEKDNYGNSIKKVPSKLGDSYIIIDTKKDLSELDQNEYNAIIAQTNFSNYNKASNYAGRFGKVSGWVSSSVKYGKWALAFL